MIMAIEGFTQVPNEVLEDINVSIQARLLYSILLSHAWETNKVFPGQGRLAEKMGTSEKSVRKYVQELKNAGYLSIKRRGLNKTNLYILNKWIPTGYKRKNLPIKKQKNSSLKKSSQLPNNNTQDKKTQSESENDNTQLTNNESNGPLFFRIMEECEPNLEKVSHITLVDEYNLHDVLTKMAGHYSARNENAIRDWTSKLIQWVMKDLMDGKIEKSKLVELEVIEYKQKEKLRERIHETVASVYGLEWGEVEGLVDKVNAFLSSHKGLRTSSEELKSYLEHMKENEQVVI